jgi:murein DD-endopeptidase MepM/ murein hydrolase activator NlpD
VSELSPPLRIPLVVTSPYGPRPALGDFHNGVDLRAPSGTKVYAANTGKVTERGVELEAGLTIHIAEVPSRAGPGIETAYAHLSSFGVALGETVQAGAIIGASGCSGTGCLAPHLHFGVSLDGGRTWVDPCPLIGCAASHVQQPPSPGLTAYPLDPGSTCPDGYNVGTVTINPIIGGIPGSLWFARPTNPDGTINACLIAGLKPGDNVTAAQVARDWSAVAVPVIVNVVAIGAGALIAWSGIREILEG